MSKIHVVFITIMAALAIFYANKSLAETVTIVSPSGTTTICTTTGNLVVCS